MTQDRYQSYLHPSYNRLPFTAATRTPSSKSSCFVIRSFIEFLGRSEFDVGTLATQIFLLLLLSDINGPITIHDFMDSVLTGPVIGISHHVFVLYIPIGRSRFALETRRSIGTFTGRKVGLGLSPKVFKINQTGCTILGSRFCNQMTFLHSLST